MLQVFYLFIQIWDLSDPECHGYLDKQGLFTACKLVALSQVKRSWAALDG
jgi:hypothetical protein